MRLIVRALKGVITSISILVILLDIFIVLSILLNGIPKNYTIKANGPILIMQEESVAFTYVDIILIVGIVAIHLALAIMMWRFWRPRRCKTVSAVPPRQ